jgi:hypothetical protein
MASEDLVEEYVPVGPPSRVEQLLEEYGINGRDVADLVRFERVELGATARWSEERAYIHRRLLRSHGEFACAGDQEALNFLREVASIMTSQFGISRQEAIARINERWSTVIDDTPAPRVWIVGLDFVYHESAEFWASDIYYGNASGWWLVGADPEPLPPPCWG